MVVIDRGLTLPNGYQSFDWCSKNQRLDPNIFLDAPKSLISALKECQEDLYLYTHHQVYFHDGIIKQTRSSPNWEGGLVTYSTCKHRMRTYSRKSWQDVWIVGLCPKSCKNNCLLFAGRVAKEFPSNYKLSGFVSKNYPVAYKCKQALINPRGDLYLPRTALNGGIIYYHKNYYEPSNHTRSVEFYERSPGSISNRIDGKIPKWWRDIEYKMRDVSPTSFILSPCWLFSKPIIWSALQPRRATLKMDANKLGKSLWQ